MLYDELSRIVEKVKQDNGIMENLSDIKGSIIFQTEDTGKKFHISVENGEILGPLDSGLNEADLCLIGKEMDFVKIIKGELDPDAAYFLGRIRFKGSFLAAVKLKNLIGKINP